MKKKIAVILCGSGYRDGSEIRESVGVLWALSRHPVEVQCFAPNVNQTDVVNCLTGATDPTQTRNMLVESARIARGQVKPLSEMKPEEFDGVILPGGFGAAKNLCDFAFKGAQGSVRPDVASVLQAIHNARKPIGAVCIAPALIALTFPDQKFHLTLGEAGEAAQEIGKLGHIHVVCAPDEAQVDAKHRIVTTPAYMYDEAPLHAIFTGIEKLVEAVVKMA